MQLAVAGEPGGGHGHVQRHADVRLEAGDIQPPGLQLQVGAQRRGTQLAGGGERAAIESPLQLERTRLAQLVVQVVDAALERLQLQADRLGASGEVGEGERAVVEAEVGDAPVPGLVVFCRDSRFSLAGRRCQQFQQTEFTVVLALQLQVEFADGDRAQLRLAAGQVEQAQFRLQLAPGQWRAVFLRRRFKREATYRGVRIGQVRVERLAPVELQLTIGVELALGHLRGHGRRHGLQRGHIHLLDAESGRQPSGGQIQRAFGRERTAAEPGGQIDPAGRGR